MNHRCRRTRTSTGRQYRGSRSTATRT